MNPESSIRNLAAITYLPKINSMQSLPLLSRCGGIDSFFQESEKAFSALCREFCFRNIPLRQAALQNADNEMRHIEKHNIELCPVTHERYPQLLKECEDAPIVFYYKGCLTPSKHKHLAIVGTRHASARCRDLVEKVLFELHQMGHNLTVTSGLAFGIDAAAHRACLKHEINTYAVLGHGLHMIYPAAHKNLAGEILSRQGALITEFPCGMTVHPGNFLKRNRIIAGLSHATLVAESAIQGGAMATARIALSYNRDVMVFPGRPEDKWSAGCNLLIKNNTAALVDSATDIARNLGLSVKQAEALPIQLNLFDSPHEDQIISILTNNNNLHIDELSRFSGISIQDLSASLLKLELEGKITASAGKYYSLI